MGPGTSYIGHQTWNNGHRHWTWEFRIIEERLSLEETKCSVTFRVVLSLSYIRFHIPCSKNVKERRSLEFNLYENGEEIEMYFGFEI